MRTALKFLIPILGNAALLCADQTLAYSGDARQGNGYKRGKCYSKCEVKCPCPTKRVCKTTCIEVRPKPPCECVTRACNCGIDLFFNADFIYWGSREGNLEFAQTTCTQTVQGGEASAPRGKTYHIGERWEPGFKVGMGLNFCDWGWDLWAQYTWYHTESAKKTASPAAGISLYDAYWFINNPTNPLVNTPAGAAGALSYTSAEAEWNYRLNVLDVELGRGIYIGRHLMIRPQFGLKAFWNRDRFDVKFSNNQWLVQSENHNETWGVGVRGGLTGAWHFTRSFAIFGKFALAALWEGFDVKREDDALNASTGFDTQAVNMRRHTHDVNPVLEWQLGVQWQTFWSGDNYSFGLFAAWEEQVWFNQNRFIRLAGSSFDQATANMTFQGLTTGVWFTF